MQMNIIVVYGFQWGVEGLRSVKLACMKLSKKLAKSAKSLHIYFSGDQDTNKYIKISTCKLKIWICLVKKNKNAYAL